MKFSLNQLGFPYDDVERNMEFLGEVGFDGVELDLTVDTGLTDEDELARLKRLADDIDLELPTFLTAHHGEYPLTSNDESTRQQGLKHCKQAIRAADALGAETALIVPGWVDQETQYDDAYDNALASIRELATVGAEHDITIAVENVGSTFFLSPLEVCEFIDEAQQSGPVGMYLDVGNIRPFGYAEHWIRILGDRLEKVHVKGYTKNKRSTYPTYPLQGDVNWKEIAAALDEVGYDDWITAEVEPYEQYGDRMPPQLLDNLHAIFE